MSKIEDLNIYSNSYKTSFTYYLDNNLILNWYPTRVVRLSSGSSLLELGLGHGYSSLNFSKHFKRHLVLEGSSELIDNFKKLKEVTPSTEITKILFEDFTTTEKFTNIVMGFILEHIEDPKSLLKQYKDYLSPEGSIFITVPNAEALNKRIGYEAGLTKDILKLSKADLALGHRRLFTVTSISKLIKDSGFRIEVIEGLLLKSFSTTQLLKLNLPRKVLEALLKVGINYPELCVGILLKIKPK